MTIEDTGKLAEAGSVDSKDTGKLAGAGPVDDKGKDDKPVSSPDSVPWDKDPRWKAWKETQTKVQKILEENDLDDVEDLIAMVEDGKKIKGKISDPDQIDDLIEKANRLSKYEEYWKFQAEKKRRSDEDPEDTVQRLEEELRKRDFETKIEQDQRKAAEENVRTVKLFERTIKDMIDEEESMPKERKAVLAEFLGVGNEINDIDITDKKAIKRLFSVANKKFDEFEQKVIQAYLAGKRKIPVVDRAAPGVEGDKKITNLKEARSVMKERLTSLFKGE